MQSKINTINGKMEKLVFFRGTKEEIYNKVNSINTQKDANVTDIKTSEIKSNDFYMDACLGIIKDHYLDFEIFVLPTNEKKVYIVTEITIL